MNEISKIVYGLWRIEGLTHERLYSNLLNLKKLNINTVDTAAAYQINAFGDSEKLLGKVFKQDKKLKDYFKVVTKCGIENIDGDWSKKYYDFSYDNIIKSAKRSYENLDQKKIELFLLHRPSVFMDYNEIYEAFKYLKENNIVNKFGVSNFTSVQFESLYNYLKKRNIELITNQIEINLLSDEHLINDNIYYLKGKEIIPMVWSPMAGGNIFKKNKLTNVLNELCEKYNTNILSIAIAYINSIGISTKIILGSHNIIRYEEAINSLDYKLTKYEMFKIFQTLTEKEIP